MKKELTVTEFIPLAYDHNGELKVIKNQDGEVKKYKNRSAVEKYCLKNRCSYVEDKHIFYS
jgi:hypothetical protein